MGSQYCTTDQTLPYLRTESKHPESNSVSISTVSMVDAVSTPAQVFVVDVEVGRNGLCVGLIDGLVTACNQQGVYVRSLLPDSSNFKVSRVSWC